MNSSKKLCIFSENSNSFVPKSACWLFPFIVFGGNLIYRILSGDIFPVNGYYLIHYLYTYSHGFVARGLVGEVLSWFFPIVSDGVTQGVMIVFNIMLAVFASLFFGKMLCSAREDKSRFQVVLFLTVVFFMLARPLDFYYRDFKLDKLLWALTFLSAFLANYKVGIWFVPLVCAVATLVNPVFLFCGMILVAIILLQEFYQGGYKAKNGIICAVSYISMIAIGLLAPITEKYIGFTTPSEMIDYYFARYSGVISQADYQLFETEWLFDYFESLENIFKMAYEIYFKDWGNGLRTILCFVFMSIPVYFVLVVFWVKSIKAHENKMQKFIFFLCAVSPVVMIPAVAISWEYSKYFYNNVLVQAGLIIYFVVKQNSAVLNAIDEIKVFCKKHLIITCVSLLYLISYIALI